MQTICLQKLFFFYSWHQEIPNGVSKCGHGGSLDQGNIGGINKDTSSPCFSPHFDFHEKATLLAEEVYI